MNWLRLTVLTAAFVGLSAPAAAFCGKESEPPCPDWHRAEPCDPGLTDEDNVCVPGGPSEEEPAPPENTPEDPPGAEAPPPINLKLKLLRVSWLGCAVPRKHGSVVSHVITAGHGRVS